MELKPLQISRLTLPLLQFKMTTQSDILLEFWVFNMMSR